MNKLIQTHQRILKFSQWMIALLWIYQGLFPKYTSGVYRHAKTNMVVSRGLGNSVLPLRIFNNPELVLVELE